MLASLLGACGAHPITEGLEQPFAIQGAQFVEGELPGLPQPPIGEAPQAPYPSALNTEVSYFRPGLADVSFSGIATGGTQTIAVRFEDLGTGYWLVPTGSVNPTIGDVLSWRFQANFHDSIPPGRHKLVVAAIDAAGNSGSQSSSVYCFQSPVPDNGNACDPKRPPPPFAISLKWDTPVDLDLILVLPTGDIVASHKPSFRDAIRLDTDSNRDCAIDGRQRENLVFNYVPARGTYLVYANLQRACGEDSVRYALTFHTQAAGEEEGTFQVVETLRAEGALIAEQQNGGAELGTFVTQFTL